MPEPVSLYNDSEVLFSVYLFRKYAKPLGTDDEDVVQQ